MSEFHLSDGFTFERKQGGDVVLRVRNRHGGEDVVAETRVTDSEWASVVAHVSRDGETSSSYDAAMSLHNGGRLR